MLFLTLPLIKQPSAIYEFSTSALCDIKLDARLPKAPKRVYKAECEDGKIVTTDLDYKFENVVASVDVGKVTMHAMVVFDI